MPKLDFYSAAERVQGMQIPPNAHACHEIVFYGEGSSGKLRIEGKHYEIRAGAVSVMHKGQVHEEVHTAPGSVIFFGFRYAQVPASGMYYDMWKLQPLFADTAQEMRMQAIGYERLASLKVAEILMYLEREQLSAQREVKDLSYCKRYIEENYMQKVSLKLLAQMTGYSVEHFRHLYTRAFGMSPQQTLIACRMARATALLRQTKRSCTEIAYLCGFSDSAQMSKMLKAAYGRTPSQIRKKGEN